MNPYKVILSEVEQDGEIVPVVTAHSLTLQFQQTGSPAMRTDVNDLSDGNFTISGKKTLLLADLKPYESDLTTINIRIKEKKALIATLEGDAKTRAEAEVAIWEPFLQGVQGLMATALKAQYELDHPAVLATT